MNDVLIHSLSSPLGTLLENTTAGSIPVSIYTHTDHFDQTINPGAVDITTYSTFFLLGNNGSFFGTMVITP